MVASVYSNRGSSCVFQSWYPHGIPIMAASWYYNPVWSSTTGVLVGHHNNRCSCNEAEQQERRRGAQPIGSSGARTLTPTRSEAVAERSHTHTHKPVTHHHLQWLTVMYNLARNREECNLIIRKTESPAKGPLRASCMPPYTAIQHHWEDFHTHTPMNNCTRKIGFPLSANSWIKEYSETRHLWSVR